MYCEYLAYFCDTLITLCCLCRDCDVTMQEILKAHFNSYPGLVGDDNFNTINVRRNHIWVDALRALSKPSFNPLNPVRVTFISEAAIDEGGPRREFFALGLSKMTEDPAIFCGLANARLFTHNLQGIRKQIFYMAGVFVALSLANGGPALKCLSESVYSYLCYGLQKGKIVSKVDKIYDDKVRTHLVKVCTLMQYHMRSNFRET